MIPRQRSLLILFVFSLLISGLGYDPLSTLIPGVAAFTLPGLVLAAFLFSLLQSIATAQQQSQQDQEAMAQSLRAEQAAGASQLDKIERSLNRLTATTQGLKAAQAEQTALLPAQVLILQKRYDDAVKWLQGAYFS